MASSQSLSDYLSKIRELVLELGELFFLHDGLYLQSSSRALASRVLILEHSGEVIRDIFLTGPIHVSEFARLLYKLLHFERYLKWYLNELSASMRSIINMELLEMTEQVPYIEFFIDMLRKWFNVDVSKKGLAAKLGVSKEHLDKVFELINGEIMKAYSNLSRRSIASQFSPPENKIRILNRDGLFEYSASMTSASRVYAFLDSRNQVASLSEALGWLYIMVVAVLEVEKLRSLIALKKELEGGFLSQDQLLGVLAKEFRENGSIAVPVSIGNTRTEVRLRKEGEKVYVCISTGEYAVREFLGSQQGAYVYFPPVDVCIELKAKQLSNEKFVVYPVEVPVMLDAYAHPSVRENKGKRRVCLGRDETFISKLILAAKDIAGGKEEKMEIDGFTVVSPDHAVAEVLKRVFAILRYGYKPGSTPYRTAASCAGIAGARVIISRRDLEELKASGVEIIE